MSSSILLILILYVNNMLILTKFWLKVFKMNDLDKSNEI